MRGYPREEEYLAEQIWGQKVKVTGWQMLQSILAHVFFTKNAWVRIKPKDHDDLHSTVL